MSFWDKMAKRYPRYDDDAMRNDVNYILSFAEQKGVLFSDKEILDIGSGTGTISIPLALRGAKHIKAIDASDAMLQILIEDAFNAHVKECMSTYLGDWSSFELIQKYDIVIASMTPAIGNEQDIEKLLSATKNIGIYVCWGKYKINNFVDTLLERHGLTTQNGSPSTMNAEKFTLFLQSKSIRYEMTNFETSWEDTFSLEQAKEYALEHLERKAITPDTIIIEKLLAEFLKNGYISVKTQAQKSIVIFFIN